MYYGSPQPVHGQSGGHHALAPEVEAMISTITPLAAKSVMSQAACSALEELQSRLDAARDEVIRAEDEVKAYRLETESLARARETDKIAWQENHDAILREMVLVRERLSAVREEHRANLEELEHARRRATTVRVFADGWLGWG